MSSPVQAYGDSGKLRKAYFDWQLSRNPSEQDAIGVTYERVNRELYHLRDIHGFKKQDWLELEVLLGLGRRLSKEIKEFLTQQRVAAARSGRTGLDDLAEAAEELTSQLGGETIV